MLKLSILLIAVLIGGWFSYDGVRAFTKGDYTTASSGAYAGQLGPWSKVVSAVGIDPRGSAMKSAHVALGVFWLISALLFAVSPRVGWAMLATCSVGSLWYLPFGTLTGIIELVLLFLPQVRNLK